MKKLSEEFGINVVNLRKALGMSQEDLAGESRVDRSTILRIEAGTSNVRLSTIEKLANALNVSPSELLRTD